MVSGGYLKCWLYRPSSLRKSGMPLAVETPAPPKNTTLPAASMRSLSCAAASTGSVIACAMCPSLPWFFLEV